MTIATKNKKGISAEAPTREGYKLTKLGWIPEEWLKYEFGDFAERSNEKYNPQAENGDNNPVCVELENIEPETGRVIDFFKANSQKSIKNKFQKGEILFGKLRPYLKKFWIATEDGVCSSEIWVLKGIEDKIESLYLYYLVQSHKFLELCKVTSGTKMPRADWDFISKMPYLIPPKKEQQKIARILSTWDKAIEKTGQLIQAKTQLKKGLMQQLLTGKKRLKEFKGEEWTEVELGRIGVFKTSSVDKKIIPGEKIVKLVNYMDVYKNKFISSKMEFLTTSAKDRETDTNGLIKGDILFTPSSETPDDIGHSAVVTEDLPYTLFSYHLVRFRPHSDSKLEYNFRGYVFNNTMILKEFSRKATGSTRYTLSKKDFEETKAIIPSKPEEQRKIALVLITCDNEIQIIQQHLKLLIDQKKGLMQKLLTGEVRVKTN